MDALLCLSCLVLCSAALPQKSSSDFSPTKWVVLGPFPNETASGGRVGLDRDFLNGEAKARFGKNTKAGEAVAKTVLPGPENVVDFAAIYKMDTDNKVAYAYGTFQSAKEQVLGASFGSDDAAKVWVNGVLVHRAQIPGRALTPGEDTFDIQAKRGANTVLVKVENGAGGWGFALTLEDAAGARARAWREARKHLANYQIVPDRHAGSGYVLANAALPKLKWKDAPLIEPLVSPEPMKVRWFDEKAAEVTSASKPGLYTAHVETATADGRPLRRMLTFYRAEPAVLQALLDWEMGTFNFLLPEKRPYALPMTDAQWSSLRQMPMEFLSNSTRDQILQSEAGAIFALRLSKPQSDESDLFGKVVPQIQLAIRRKLMGLGPSNFKVPQKSGALAPTLRNGSEAEAGMKAGTVAKLTPILEAWSKEEGKPFSVVLARNGVVFHHAAFGELNGKPLGKDATFYPASIGKTFAGLVFAQFFDQGLIAPDDPLGKYLPDFPKAGPQAVTFRNCLTHTSGTAGHQTYGGFWNPYLDNAFSLWLPSLNPGVRFAYGGDGNNLAAKALELISGKPMMQLLDECLFGPLEAKILEPDLGFAVSASAWDVAKVGQMVLNKGAYGSYRFFSEETYRRFLPTKLKPLMPGLNDPNLEWGWAVSYMPDPDGPREQGVLGPNVVGHGSASSSILRIDPDTQLLVVIGRYGIGNGAKYNEYRVKFMKALRESVKE